MTKENNKEDKLQNETPKTKAIELNDNELIEISGGNTKKGYNGDPTDKNWKFEDPL